MLFDLVEGGVDAGAVGYIRADADCLTAARGDVLNDGIIIVRIAG